MTHAKLLLGLAPLLLLASVTPSYGQLGFSNRQLRVLTAINQANQNQQRIRQTQQNQAIGAILGQQQQQIQNQQQANQSLQEALLLGDPSLLANGGVRGTSRTAALFGQVYQGSSYYNRLGPYYDYGFIQRRNRSPALGLSGGQVGVGAPGTNVFGGSGLAPGLVTGF